MCVEHVEGFCIGPKNDSLAIHYSQDLRLIILSLSDPATYWTCQGHLPACRALVWVRSGSEGRGL